MAKYDFAKVQLTDIEGKPLEGADLHKQIGNQLYFGDHKDLDLVEKGRAMYKGEAVELDKTEIESLKALLDGTLKPFARKAVYDYIDSVEK